MIDNADKENEGLDVVLERAFIQEPRLSEIKFRGAFNVPCLNVPKPWTYRDTNAQFRAFSFLVD